MIIEAGFAITYECAAPTPMLLALKIHPSRCADLLAPHTLTFSQDVQPRDYTDLFGNVCTRIVAPAGQTTISTTFSIADSGLLDFVTPDARQHPVQELPDDVLVFLLGSRYCDTDQLAKFAWSRFANTPLGWGRVQAICDFVHQHIEFDYMKADATRTAHDGFTDRMGVCRDFAHLAITLCRCMNIPARYCTGYLGDIGVPVDPSPMDFSAWFEVYLDGQWHTFDARHNVPRIGRILIARGRDATDVALSTSFGAAHLAAFSVVTREAAQAKPQGS